MSNGETHFDAEQTHTAATAETAAAIPEGKQPVKEEVKAAAEAVETKVAPSDVAAQNLADGLDSGIAERNEKSPSEIYRLGNMISPTIQVDYLSLYSQHFPKAKMKDGELHFASQQDREYAENYSAAVQFYTPGAIGDRMLEREGSRWQNGFTKPDGQGRVTPRSHAKSGKSASALLNRVRGTGAPITLWLPHTGIYVTFTAPKEADYCEYDIQQTMETAEAGRLTHGLTMNMGSGIYLKGQVEFALRYAIATTYDCEGGDIAQTLVTVIKQQDYGLVINGPTIAKFPGGIPWTFMCPDGTCRHNEEKLLNLSRSIRNDDFALSDFQRSHMVEYTRPETVTADMLEKYQAEFRETKSSKFTSDFEALGEITVEFQMTTLHDYFVKTVEWVKELGDAAKEALANRATAHERETFMRNRNEARRLTRYAHMVKAITVKCVDGDEILEERETDKNEIVNMLTDLTSDREYTNKFEEAIQQYIIDNTHTLIGYRAHPCPKCGNKHVDTKTEGPFRGIVPISPDRIFFALSQQVSMVTSLLSNRSD